MASTTAPALSEIYIRFSGAMDGVYAAASSGISNYVIPIAWILLSIVLLAWALATMSGKTSVSILEWFTPFIAFILILYAMGGGYVQWVADPIFKLPEQLAGAVGHTGSANPIDSITVFETKFSVLLAGAFSLISQYGESGAYGAAVVLSIIVLIMIMAAAVMIIVMFAGIVYAKIGLTLVLSVGPFFILMLVLQSMRDKFYAWLSTALYFVLYYLLCVLFVALFFSILDKYMSAITSIAGAGGGQSEMQRAAEFVRNVFGGGDEQKTVSVITSFFPVILLTGIMAFMFLQLSTIAASITSGSGGSVGQGASSLVFYASRFFGGSARK